MKVEIPFGCQLKYEEDKDTGLMTATRIVPHIYPAVYGYIPNTLAEDNDPLDIFLVDGHVHYRDIFPGVALNVEILGMIHFLDNDEIDHKIIAKLDDGKKIDDLTTYVNGIKKFLKTYKPEVDVHVGNFKDAKHAEAYVTFCEERYEKK